MSDLILYHGESLDPDTQEVVGTASDVKEVDADGFAYSVPSSSGTHAVADVIDVLHTGTGGDGNPLYVETALGTVGHVIKSTDGNLYVVKE